MEKNHRSKFKPIAKHAALAEETCKTKTALNKTRKSFIIFGLMNHERKYK